jgi:hypothetical protein
MILTVDERYAAVFGAVAIQAVAAPLLLVAGGTWGVEMAALVLGTGRAMTAVVSYIGCRRRYGLPYPWAFATKLLAAAAVMGLALIAGRALWATSLLEAIVLTAAGAIVFGLGVRGFGVIGPDEISLLRRANLPGGRWMLALLGAPAEAR